MMAAISCTPAKQPPRLYTMGERAEAGKIVYSVLEASWRKQLGEAGQHRLPQKEFLLVRLSVTNGGASQASIPAARLVAPSGAEYPELTDGTGVDDWMGVLRHLKPNETQFGWILFDAPRGDYQLRVTDDAFDPADAIAALIQIPLKMESKPDALPEPRPTR
jgi:hypothetical protein